MFLSKTANVKSNIWSIKCKHLIWTSQQFVCNFAPKWCHVTSLKDAFILKERTSKKWCDSSHLQMTRYWKQRWSECGSDHTQIWTPSNSNMQNCETLPPTLGLALTGWSEMLSCGAAWGGGGADITNWETFLEAADTRSCRGASYRRALAAIYKSIILMMPVKISPVLSLVTYFKNRVCRTQSPKPAQSGCLLPLSLCLYSHSQQTASSRGFCEETGSRPSLSLFLMAYT